MIRTALVVLAFSLPAPTNASASAERAATGYRLIAQRLALMQPVATWKYVNGIPVEAAILIMALLTEPRPMVAPPRQRR